MEWIFVKDLQSEGLINEYEEVIKYHFPEDFKNCVRNYNGAYPVLEVFLSFKGKRKKKKETSFKSSFLIENCLYDSLVGIKVGGHDCFNDLKHSGEYCLYTFPQSAEKVPDAIPYSFCY